MKTIIGIIASLVLAGAALAQSTQYGDPNFDRQRDWRSGMPNVLRVSAGNVNHAMDGSPVQIPFTLDGGPAEVYLAVYSKDANPQYGGAPFAAGGRKQSILRRAGMDTLIAITAGQTFPEGANTLSWNGKDFNNNQVPPGKYTYYLFALDNISNPTLVGPGANPGYWSSFSIDKSQNPPVVWSPRFIDATQGHVVQRAIMGTDYIQNPGAWQSLDVSWISKRYSLEPLYRDLTFYQVDPNNPNVGYMGRTSWSDNALPQGVWKVVYDPANQTLLPDESWSQSNGGFVALDRRVVGGALKPSVNHPWVADDGMLYVADMDRVPPMTPSVVVIDRATGEIVNLIDLTDIYYSDYPENGGPDTSGPYGIDVDERGVYTTGFWIQRDAYPGHFTLDGDVIWVNKNGDGFLDRYFGEEATALGIDPNRDQMVNTHVKVGKYNIAFLSGFNQPYWASVVGPDGHGLFNINLPKMPVGLGTDLMWISNNSPIDGIYVGASGGQDLVQWPFDVAKAVVGTGVTTAVLEQTGAAPSRFALAANYPNPFNASTTIGFSIPERNGALPTTLTIYNTTGQLIATLVAGELGAGQYQVRWDGTDDQARQVASGVYLYRLHAGQEFVETRQMTLLK
jgi:flagellar hook assembly protein FlgD